MAIRTYHHALNVGQYDRDKLHRIDVDRLRLAAEVQQNFLCDAVGKAFGRPGTEYIATTRGGLRSRVLSFVAGDDDAFVLELTNNTMRVIDGDTDDLVTRAAVTSTVVSGDFSSSTGWTLAATSGQTSAITGGELQLSARAHGGKAKASQAVTTASIGIEHALRIQVTRGPVTFRLGSTSGGAEYLPSGVETTLFTGTHSIAFTPSAATYYVEFSTEAQVLRKVFSCQVEAAGVMELPTQWTEALLPYIRDEQSLDVMFVACAGVVKPQRIESRGDTSWSVVDYDFVDGPFVAGSSASLTLTPSVTEGNGTLTASAPFFTANHVGSLFRLFHQGQKVDTYVAGDNEFTPSFLVTGITETNFEERKFTSVISGTWSGTLRHQRSYDGEDGQYHAYRREQGSATIDITSNATYVNDDNDDNIDVNVRMGFETGTYTSGEAHIVMTYAGGGGFGICRVVGFTSPTVVDIEVINPFSGTGATDDWRECRYSPIRGWPSAVVLHDGRLNWAGSDQFDGSISDAYDSFDEDYEGDAGPLSRSIALGGRNEARWMISLNSLMLGCDARVANVRASSFDEILTPDNFNMKTAGKIGAAPVSPVELADDRAVFVQRAGNVLYEITWSNEKGRYIVSPFSKLTANMFLGGILDMDVQVLPDQRIWVPVDGGDMICIVFEPTQQVLAAHIPMNTGGDTPGTDFFESVAVLPGIDQDKVYVSVKRVVNGTTVRFIEKFAKDAESVPQDICKMVDAHMVFGAGSAVITGLGYLEGRTVVVWADGDSVDEDDSLGMNRVVQNFTVTNGQITLPFVPAIGGVVGLPYEYRYKSARLAYGADGETAMLQNKLIGALGMLLGDYCRSGVKWGTVNDETFEAPWSLPELSGATRDTAAEITYGPGADEPMMPTDGQIGLDARLCIQGQSPKPLTLLSLVFAIETRGA